MLMQRFFYPLYHIFDENLFANTLEAVKNKYEFIGSKEEKIFLIKSLFYYQLITKDYRKLLRILNKNLAQKTDIRKINNLVRKTEFKKDLSWVIWLFEKEMIKLVNKFWQSKNLKFMGNDAQFNEFILRYLISIWLVDWAGPCFATLKASENGVINLKECNEILFLWDFTKIFANYNEVL